MTIDAPIGIIAGTGFYSLAQLEDAQEQTLETAYGQAKATTGKWHGLDIVFQTRHGASHSVPPHLVNYHANISAFVELGVQDVFAISAVGGIDETLQPGDLVCLDDFLDFTKNRNSTFCDGTGPRGVFHTDVTYPYNQRLREELLTAAQNVGIEMRAHGVYCAFEGPRFETPAEVRMARILGGDVAGMTGVPECPLAAEAGLNYAGISIVCNPGAGISAEPISHEEVGEVLKASGHRVLQVLDEVLRVRATAQR